MPCSISRCYFSETIGTQRPQSTGGGISQMTVNLNGQRERDDP
jgi:hypothetical protein